MEVVVVMGILVAISLVILPFTISQIEDARAENQALSIASELFSSQQDAYSGRNSSGYGVKLNSDSYVVFIGDTLAGASYSDTLTLPQGTSITDITFTGGASEVAFLSGSFRPNRTGSFRINDGVSIYQVTLNAQGLISVDKI